MVQDDNFSWLDVEVRESHLPLSPFAGCHALAALMQKLDLNRIAHRLRVKKLPYGLSDAQFAQLMVLLLATGHSDFADLGRLRDDPFLTRLLQVKRLPHANTCREYLGRFDHSGILALKALVVHPLAFAELLPDPIGQVPVDVDASVFVQHGTRKQGAAWAYNGEFGYQPLFAFIGRQGFLLEAELRPGNQNGVDQADLTIEQAFDRLPEAVQALPLLYRLDAGFYSHAVADTIRLLGKDFLIKAKLTAPLLAAIEALPEDAWQPAQSPAHPKVPSAFAELRYQPAGWDRPCRFVVRRDTHYNDELFPEQRYFAYVTSLDQPAEAVDACYRRRGQAENYIKELQYDLDLECLPSGNFTTNQVFLQYGALTYNLLLLIGQERQGPKVPKYVSGRMSLKSIRRQFVVLAGYFRTHARQLSLMLSHGCAWIDGYRHMLARLRALPAPG